MTPAGFEEDVRRDLAWRKVETTVKAGAQVSDAEVEQAFAYRKEQVRAAWALVDVPALMKSTAASDAEIEAFLKDSPAQFKRPARRRVQYVLADAKEWVAGIPDSEVEQYYREHASEFELPRQVNAAHVLVGVAQTGGSASETAARGKAQDAIRRAKAGEDFGKLAKELSEDPRTAAQGGELGWIVKGQLVPPFEEAAFVLKKGEITSSPVRTQFGFHVIKVLDVKEGGRKPLKEVTPQIRAKIVTERIDKAATTKAQEVRPVLAAAKDFAAEAKRLGLESRESMIAKASGARGADRGEAMQEAAFGLAIGGVSQPVKTPAGVVILKVMEQLPAGVPPLADIKDEVANAVKRKKAEAAAFERARKLAADARTGDLVPLAKREGLQGGETPRFSRLKPAERIPREVLVAALQTPAGALGEPVKTPQGYYVVKTLERVPADPADLGKEREQIARELLETKRNEAWESWVAAAREKAKIEVSGRLTSPL